MNKKCAALPEQELRIFDNATNHFIFKTVFKAKKTEDRSQGFRTTIKNDPEKHYKRLPMKNTFLVIPSMWKRELGSLER